MVFPLDRFVNAVLYWCYQRVDDRVRFDYVMEQPIAGRVTKKDVDNELDEFSNFMQRVT